ncbi:LLM class flavin-dependent oxidoreductase [Patulibacter sp. NPDC049589]|uniref:LLM class flavin-dependent oxidoreductase n=1 Tax=Patulibacter sp. NPDC049589 TaxID=3154731 RepID=UPI0034448783
MPVEFISATHITPVPSAHGHNLSGFDPDYTRRFARMLDDGGFDWTLIAYHSGAPDSLQLAQFVAENTERIRPVVAHRPGFVFPTQFAKGIAGLDRISDGRVMIHIISGGSDAEQRREGDHTTKEQRYRRSEEFIDVLRRVWTADGPISHRGEFYAFEDFHTDLKPLRGPVPISVGGSSQQAYDVGGRTGDVFGLWGEPLAETAAQIASVNAVADAAGRRRPRIWNSFRPIVAATDELAWEKARGVLAGVRAAKAARSGSTHPGATFLGEVPTNVGALRLQALAERGELHDRCLWTPLAREFQGQGSTTALVGSYETVAAALVDYAEIGCDLLSIRGWDVWEDAQDYARHVLPLVRQELAHRAATGRAVVANGDSAPAATPQPTPA